MLEALGNLGDFIGGIAVVATLVYLAVQVRQNTLLLRESTKLARVQARDTAFRSFSEFRSKIVSSPDVADLYLEGLRDPGALEPRDRLRFNLLASELFYILQTSLQRATDLGTGGVNDTMRGLGIESIVRSRGMVAWWKENRSGFDSEFAAVIDSHVQGAESGS